MSIGVRSQPTALRKASFGRAGKTLGFPFLLILIYLLVEYVRPPEPMKIPLIISVLLFAGWMTLSRKTWSPQATCFLLLLSVMAVTGPFATNSYAAWWGFVGMTVELLFICIPMMHFVSSMRKLSIFINAWVALGAYLALYGIVHGGQGPGGHVGDENDLALALNMIIPYAYMSLFSAAGVVQKTFLLSAFGVMVAAVVATFSRGGFLGLLSLLLYCLLVSPRKKVAMALGSVLIVGALLYAPSAYWNRVATILDEASDTAAGTGALRREYWAIARQMFYDNPIFGVGVGNFPWNVSLYESSDQMAQVGRSYAGQAVHSLYFSILAELGLAGALIFLALAQYNIRDTRLVMAQCAIWGRRRRPSQGTPSPAADSPIGRNVNKARCYAHAVGASMVGYLVSGIFLSVFSYPHFWILTAVTVALRGATAEVLKDTDGSETVSR